MTLENARKITENTIIWEKRHPDYEKCCEIAKKSAIFVTGEGQADEYLIPLRDKETKRQKEIRVKVSKPITPFALNPVRTEFQKMFRVDGVHLAIEGEEMNVVNEAIETYHSNASINTYFERRYVHWNFLDPNGWHVTERRNKVDELGRVVGVDVYPLEVTSEQAVNYEFDNGVPVWLIVKQERYEMVAQQDANRKTTYKNEEVEDYFFYAAGIALRYSGYIQTPLEGITGEPIELTELAEGENETKKFIFQDFQTGSKEFPGYKWGAYDELESNGTVKVPPFWDGARFVLEDLIETKSVFDVSRHNHVFPKLFHYDEPCDYHDENGHTCMGGKMEGTGHTCPQCNGAGGKLHFSESDIVTFAMPKDMEDLSKLPALSSLAYYHQPPLDVTQELYSWIKDFLEWVYIASFNSTNVDKAFAAKTATEISAIYDAINARVYSSATWWSRMVEKTVRVTSQYLGKDVKVRHSVPMDMKLESLDVLLARYSAAIDMPHEVKDAILHSILGKTFLDNPSRVESIKAWSYWKPFKSMSNETILFLLQSRANDDFDKILYENWDNVQIEVENTLPATTPFAKLDRAKQFELIQKAVATVYAKIKFQSLDSAGQIPDLTAQNTDDSSMDEPVV